MVINPPNLLKPVSPWNRRLIPDTLRAAREALSAPLPAHAGVSVGSRVPLPGPGGFLASLPAPVTGFDSWQRLLSASLRLSVDWA